MIIVRHCGVLVPDVQRPPDSTSLFEVLSARVHKSMICMVNHHFVLNVYHRVVTAAPFVLLSVALIHMAVRRNVTGEGGRNRRWIHFTCICGAVFVAHRECYVGVESSLLRQLNRYM